MVDDQEFDRTLEAYPYDPQTARRLLAECIEELLRPLERPLVIGEQTPTVIMVVGVNVLFWRPLTAWAERFRVEESEAAEAPRHSMRMAAEEDPSGPA